MWRLLSCFMVAAVVGIASVGCDGGGDEGGDERALSGDSGLKIQNVSSDDMTVYFDGGYIGNVPSHGERTWSVPSGSHRVEIDNAEHDLSERWSETLEFAAGSTVELVMTFEDK